MRVFEPTSKIMHLPAETNMHSIESFGYKKASKVAKCGFI